MKDKVIFQKQQFLNSVSHADSGFYSGSIIREYWDNKTHYCGTFTVADCSRRASLDFSFDTKREKRQRLAKVKKLIAGLEELRDAMEEVDV